MQFWMFFKKKNIYKKQHQQAKQFYMMKWIYNAHNIHYT